MARNSSHGEVTAHTGHYDDCINTKRNAFHLVIHETTGAFAPGADSFLNKLTHDAEALQTAGGERTAALTGSGISVADDTNVREVMAREWPGEWGRGWGCERHRDDIEDEYDSDDPDSDFEDHVAHDDRIFLERFLRSMGDGSGDGELADAEA